jgi:membrane protein required for colicin V production
MDKLDLLFLVLLGAGFIRGWIKGAIMQLAALAAIILGVYGAISFYEPVAHFLEQSFHFSIRLAVPFAFLLLFIAIGFGLYLAGKLLTTFFKAISLSWIDRLLGAVVGLLKIALVMGILLQLFAFADFSAHETHPAKPQSALRQTLEAFPSQVLPFFHLHSM